MFKSLATAASLILATLALSSAAQAGGCHHGFGGGFGGGYGGGYSSYQSYPSYSYGAERRAEARAIAARRAKLAAVRSEKLRVAKAEAVAGKRAKTAEAKTEAKTEVIAKVTETSETKGRRRRDHLQQVRAGNRRLDLGCLRSEVTAAPAGASGKASSVFRQDHSDENDRSTPRWSPRFRRGCYFADPRVQP